MQVAAGIVAVLQAQAHDAHWAVAARGLDLRVVLDCGAERIALRMAASGLTLPATGTADIRISADADHWRRVLARPPPPLYNAFTAVQLRNSAFRIDGEPLLIAQARPALEYLWSIIAATRGVRDHAPLALDQVRGRYARVALPDGRAATLFLEEAGVGTPMLLLHTAGADSRQYHGQLGDAELQRHWRMVAFDMPAHGRSMPLGDPSGTGPYRLTMQEYLGWVGGFIDQVIGERVVLVGCSMGAAISLAMAATTPERLLGVVALEAPLRARGRRNPFLADMRVSGGAHAAAYVAGLMSPSSPDDARARAQWIYAQGGPGIYDGDLVFYSEEFDGETIGRAIDASQLPVALLTGDYDYSASPEDTRVVAQAIPGCHFRAMSGLGHFPMTENPALFKPHFLEALAFVHERFAALP